MIVVAGEVLVDLVEEEDGLFRAVGGGSPANVAVGLARLGVPTQFLARLGTGRFGEIVRSHLVDNGIGLAYAVTTTAPATLAVVSVSEGGHASYDFYVDGTADWGWTQDELPASLPADTVALCTGSLGAGPALVVLTRGTDGATAMARGGARVDLPARPVDVVDTVGAGDAFTAGLLDGLGRHGLLGPGGSDRLAE